MQGEFHGRNWYLERHVVTVATGSGTKIVTFEAPFVNTPEIKVIPPEGSAGTYSATSASKSGFTISVSGETDLDNQDVVVFVFVMEKP
ncbi:MAG: hypothetical protein ACE5ES_00705 [Candidatus Nanoarchaeia archaeon]